jgi:hypothetical protein
MDLALSHPDNIDRLRAVHDNERVDDIALQGALGLPDHHQFSGRTVNNKIDPGEKGCNGLGTGYAAFPDVKPGVRFLE